MNRFSILSLFLSAIFVPCLASGAGGQPKKLPIPDKKALATAEDLVNDIFKEEIAKAKEPDARAKLAAYLVQQGDESGDDPAARYVLYGQARELAILGGHPVLTFSIIDKLAKSFDVSALDLKADALGKLVSHVPPKEPSKALVDLTLTLITEALEADNYDTALELGKVANMAAKNAQIVQLVGTVNKRNAEIKAAKEKFSVLQPFVDRLKKDASDAEANLRLGEYFGFFKGKWDRALPYLAKSKSEPLAGLADRDLQMPKETKDMDALADDWWQFAAKQAEPQQSKLQERAVYWYDKAMPGLSGLHREKAIKRITQVATRSQGVRPVVDGPVGFLKTLEGHKDEIRGLAISADGRYGLSSGSLDNTMRLWDLSSGKEVQVFKGHTQRIWDVAFVPGGKYVVSVSWDRTAKLWDMHNGQVVTVYNHPVDVNAVAISKDGQWMLTGCDDKHMRLWDLTKNEEVRRFPPHTNFCYSVAFAPNGLLAASGSMDRTAIVYELTTGKVLREFQQANFVSAVAFSGDSKYLFTCGDNAVHMWDIATGKEERRFEPTTGYILAMALTPDGKRLVTGGEDQKVRVWDVTTGKEVARFDGHTKTITAVAVSNDGRRALSGQADGQIRYWGLPAR